MEELMSQNSNIEELKFQLANSDSVNERIHLLNELSYNYRTSNTDTALAYVQEALNLSLKNKYHKGIINSYSNYGIIYQYVGNYTSSLEYFQKGLSLLDTYPDDEIKAKIFNNIGNLYWRSNDKELAYEYYKKSMLIREMLNDSIGLAKVLGNLGNSIGAIYHDGDSAFYYYTRALNIFRAQKDSSGLSITYSNLANIFKVKGNVDQAISYYHNSLSIDKSRGDLYGLTFSYSNLGSTHKDLGNLDSAIYYFKLLLSVANEINSLPRQKQAYGRLYSLYEGMSDYEKAFKFLKLYKQADDSLMNQSPMNRMTDLKLKFDNDLKTQEIDLLKAQSDRNKLELAKKYWQILFLVMVLIILSGIAVAFWFRFKIKNRLYEILSDKSKELSSAQELIELRNEELISINENLEQKVGDRTKELNKAYQNLLISNQRLDHFTYRSAHDLKGPIASILGLINLLKMELEESENKLSIDYVDLLNHTALKMDNLLKRIVSSYQIHQTLVKKEEINVDDLINQVVETIRVNDPNNDITISCILNGGKIIHCDIAILLIIIRYLIYNSIKYRDSKKTENRIIIQTESSKNGFYQIHIMDNGKGIDPELIPNLFNMFTKGASEASNPGLGLYDANLLAEKIGGEVYFEETDNEFTHFVLSFPYLG